MRNFTTSLLLLGILFLITCGIYPLALWCVGQTLFSFQANGSMLHDHSGNIIGSKLIAQKFVKDQYFQPRPSAANYDASASTSSALAPSNYALRVRIARLLGPIVKYDDGKLVAPDIISWVQQNKQQGVSNKVKAWESIFPHIDEKIANKDIPAAYFDLWREDHPDVELQKLPADMVTTSASGLDPHISLPNAELQLERVAAAIATKENKDPKVVTAEIHNILQSHTQAPLAGLVGESFVNVLEVNLELQQKYSL